MSRRLNAKRAGHLYVWTDITAGWGKVNGTQVKNHYPKGLRNKI